MALSDYDYSQAPALDSGDAVMQPAADSHSAPTPDAVAASAGPAMGDPDNPMLASVGAGPTTTPPTFGQKLRQLQDDEDNAVGRAMNGQPGLEGALGRTAADTLRLIPGMEKIVPSGEDTEKAVDKGLGIDPAGPADPNPGAWVGGLVGGTFGEAATIGMSPLLYPVLGPAMASAGGAVGAIEGRMIYDAAHGKFP
jgi:hypothetical protein